jgi:hypothetical protein
MTHVNLAGVDTKLTSRDHLPLGPRTTGGPIRVHPPLSTHVSMCRRFVTSVVRPGPLSTHMSTKVTNSDTSPRHVDTKDELKKLENSFRDPVRSAAFFLADSVFCRDPLPASTATACQPPSAKDQGPRYNRNETRPRVAFPLVLGTGGVLRSPWSLALGAKRSRRSPIVGASSIPPVDRVSTWSNATMPPAWSNATMPLGVSRSPRPQCQGTQCPLAFRVRVSTRGACCVEQCHNAPWHWGNVAAWQRGDVRRLGAWHCAK